MIQGSRVLVVDDVADLEEVLQTVLEPRGLQVGRLRAETAAPPAAAEARPSVVVIDAESYPCPGDVSARYADVPQVILGRVNWRPDPGSSGREVLRKPYQYAELIAAIERALPHA